MPKASVAQQGGPAASPTLAPSSAPRTETTTAAPASVHSLHLEVDRFTQLLLLINPHLNLSLLITYVVKHFYPLPCKFQVYLKCISFSLSTTIKLLLTYSCTFGFYISWTSIQSILTLALNFDTFPLLQVGGLKLVVHLT